MAGFRYRDAGSLRSIRKLFYRDAGVLRTLRKAWYRDAGVLRLVFVLVHEVTAPAITGFSISPQHAQGSSTAAVTGGVGPFGYSWAWLSGGQGITLGGTSTATVTATRDSTAPGSSGGTLRVTVVDQGNANATATADVDVTLETE